MPLSGNQLEKQPVIVIIGPTAVGKTASAISAGQELDAEIVSADSRQVYQQMDIGTAKPTPEELAALPHHLIDVVPPDIRYNVADFKRDAAQLIDDIHGRRKLPMIVGGTGQYITALIEGWQIPEVEPDHELRAELEAYAKEHGWQGLLERLREVDPVHAEQVDAKNLRRVIRAIEVSVISGRPYSDFRVKHPPPYTVLELGLTLDREALYERADRRVDAMIETGLVAEVEELVAAGYAWNLPAMTSLGYLQIGNYLQGKLTLNEALEDLCHATHHFIRRQYTWFRKYNADAIWFESNTHTANTLLATIRSWLRQL
jgi:tRNA dimethylallyltransferase